MTFHRRAWWCRRRLSKHWGLLAAQCREEGAQRLALEWRRVAQSPTGAPATARGSTARAPRELALAHGSVVLCSGNGLQPDAGIEFARAKPGRRFLGEGACACACPLVDRCAAITKETRLLSSPHRTTQRTALHRTAPRLTSPHLTSPRLALPHHRPVPAPPLHARLPHTLHSAFHCVANPHGCSERIAQSQFYPHPPLPPARTACILLHLDPSVIAPSQLTRVAVVSVP
jgi:hypothetical protein